MKLYKDGTLEFSVEEAKSVDLQNLVHSLTTGSPTPSPHPPEVPVREREVEPGIYRLRTGSSAGREIHAFGVSEDKWVIHEITTLAPGRSYGLRKKLSKKTFFGNYDLVSRSPGGSVETP